MAIDTQKPKRPLWKGEWYLLNYSAQMEFAMPSSQDPSSPDFDPNATTWQARTRWDLQRAMEANGRPKEIASVSLLKSGPTIAQGHESVALNGSNWVITDEIYHPTDETNTTMMMSQSLSHISPWAEVDFDPTSAGGGDYPGQWSLVNYRRARMFSETAKEDPDSEEFEPENTTKWARLHYVFERKQVQSFAPRGRTMSSGGLGALSNIQGPGFMANGLTVSIGGEIYILTGETVTRNDTASWKFLRTQKMERFGKWEEVDFGVA